MIASLLRGVEYGLWKGDKSLCVRPRCGATCMHIPAANGNCNSQGRDDLERELGEHEYASDSVERRPQVEDVRQRGLGVVGVCAVPQVWCVLRNCRLSMLPYEE